MYVTLHINRKLKRWIFFRNKKLLASKKINFMSRQLGSDRKRRLKPVEDRE